MKRDQNEAVTEFVLLIPTSEPGAVGEATFLSEIDRSQRVRPISLEEIRTTAKSLKGSEAVTFDALLALKGALESGDLLAESQALQRWGQVYRMRESELPKDERHKDGTSGRLFGRLLGMDPDEAAKYMDGLRVGQMAAQSPARLFSFEVTRCIGSVPDVFSHAKRKPLSERPQIVLWWFQGAFRPAIYCPDPSTALYIHTFFLAPMSGLGFRICPYDGKQFFQERTNQDYCCPAHREAHRVARFRANQKRNAGEQQKAGRKRGPKKAR